MEIGIDSFGAVISDLATGLVVLSPVQRMRNLLEETEPPPTKCGAGMFLALANTIIGPEFLGFSARVIRARLPRERKTSGFRAP